MFFLLLLLGMPWILNAQTDPVPTPTFTLSELVDFALINGADVRRSELDQQIGERQLKSRLSGWLPQISANYQFSNNIKLQTQPIGDELITFGQPFASNLNFSATQTLFDRDQFFASKGAGLVKEELRQSLETARINKVVSVAKAYYDILLTYEQIRILDENMLRQEKQFQDAKSRYEAGLVDKTDYQRAGISLANLKSDRKRTNASLGAKYAYLKELVGFPADEELVVAYTYESLEEKAKLKERSDFSVEQRVEYRLAKTQVATSELTTKYAQWAYIPTLNGFYNYNFLFFNQDFSDLYGQSFSTSSVGLTVAIPLFQGGKRVQEVKIARLQQDRAGLVLKELEMQLHTEYERSLANYQSSYYEWETLRSNKELAREVYETIKLQYDEGVKAYVDLIIAETELRTAQLNHYNSLFMVLSNKLDLMRALGQINPSSIESSL